MTSPWKVNRVQGHRHDETIPMKRNPMEYTPHRECAARISALQTRIVEAGLAGALIFQPVDMFYLAGTIQNGVLSIPASGPPLLAVQKNLDRAETESPLETIVPLGRFGDLPVLVESEDGGPPGPLGLELDVLPAATYLKLRKLFPGVEWVDVSPAIREVRAVKSAYEVERMRRAAERHAEVFGEIGSLIEPGMSELALSARIEEAMRRRGHQGVIRMRNWRMELFYGPVVSGPSAVYPSYFDGPVGAEGLYPAVPQGGGRRTLRPGEPILIDLVFGYGGYLVDKARTFVIGEAGPEVTEAIAFTRTVQDEIVRRLVPGALCREIYRDVAASVETSRFAPYLMGHGRNRVGFFGHGVGLELDELPVIAPRGRAALVPGMTVAVEPKVFIPDLGGIGVENTFLIREGGAEKITEYPDDLIVL